MPDKVVGGKRTEFLPDGRHFDLRPGSSLVRPILILGGSTFQLAKDGVYLVSDGTGNTAISLPPPLAKSSDVTIRNSTAGTVTVFPSGGTLEGVRTSYAMTTKDLRIMAVAAGVWRIVTGA